MNKWMVRIGSLVLVVVMALGAVATVGAQGPGGNRPGQGGPIVSRLGDRDRIIGALVQAVADATGLTVQDVLQAARQGDTLTAICEANGADPTAVAASVTAQTEAQLAQLVADGRITQDQADNLLARLTNMIDTAMTTALPGHMAQIIREHPVKARGVAELVQALTGLTGVSNIDVMQAMRDGSTLADIAAANGVTSEAVVAAALAQTSELLQARVDAGTMTPERMAELLAEAETFYANAMTQPLPERPTPVRDRLQDAMQNSLVGALADAAGVEAGQIIRDAVTPDSLAEVAAAYGLDADALISTAEANITAQINEMVAAGTLTQDEADQLLAGLHDWLVERFNAPFRVRPWAGGGMQGGMPGGMPGRPGGMFGGQAGPGGPEV